jgi:hypothetical protein
MDNLVVIHKKWERRYQQLGYTVVYIGRPSAFGNPFVLGKHGDRAGVIAGFKEWMLQSDAPAAAKARIECGRLAKRLLEGERIALMCWCSPQPCHGDIIRERVLQIYERAQEPDERGHRLDTSV